MRCHRLCTIQWASCCLLAGQVAALRPLGAPPRPSTQEASTWAHASSNASQVSLLGVAAQVRKPLTGKWTEDLGYPTQRVWRKEVRSLPPKEKAKKAALIYVQLGPWPNYVKFVIQAASLNKQVEFYFLGPRLRLNGCPHCHWLPLDYKSIKATVQKRLNLTINRSVQEGWWHPSKMCDLKPMFLYLFPDITARHHWVGWGDHDILLGNLDEEFANISDDVDVIVPGGFFPKPLANGNLLFLRTVPEMIEAFKDKTRWPRAVIHPKYVGFDEWWGEQVNRPNFYDVLQRRLRSKNLKVQATRKSMLQDMVIANGLQVGGTGGSFGFTIEQSSHVLFRWRKGQLEAERIGPCLCPEKSDWGTYTALSGCDECGVVKSGKIDNITVHKKFEALGFHFQVWKKRHVWKECTQRPGNNTACYPTCPESEGFNLQAYGFECYRPGPRDDIHRAKR